MGEHADELHMDTLSGNDPGDDPGTETPDDGGTDTGSPSEQPPEPGGDAGGNEQEPGHGTENPGEEDQENPPAADQDEQPAAGTGDGVTDEQLDRITDRLEELMEPEDETDVTERLDALIALLTPEETEGEEEPEPYAGAFAFEDYREWEYPVFADYMVYPYGMGNWLEQTQTFDSADAFITRFEEIRGLCGEGGTLKDFYVKYIWDGNETLVYDYEARTPEPDPGPGDEEQKETAELLLSHLEGINAALSEMIQADTAYRTAALGYQQEMLEMQQLSTACNVILCVAAFAIFMAQIWAEFFRRFK